MTDESIPTPKPADPEPTKPEPETVEVEPQTAKNPIEARMETVEDGIKNLLKRQDERDQRERRAKRGAKFTAAKNKTTGESRREMETDKQTKGGGDSRTQRDDTHVQRKTRFRFRKRAKPAG